MSGTDQNDYEKRLKKKIEKSVTTVIKLVLPNTTNMYNTLFGGIALQWIDEVAGIAATRFCNKTVVTVSFDRTDFRKPIPAGNIVELTARIVAVGTTSMQVRVKVYREDMYKDQREKAIESLVTFVAIENGKPVPVVV